MNGITFSNNPELIDWKDLASVFERAPLGTREPSRLGKTFSGSSVCTFAWHETHLIGAGRAVSDGVVYTAIFDVVVLPDYQGKGIGKAIIEDLISRCGTDHFILFAVPGKEGFYEKLGFEKMNTAMGRFKDPMRQRQLGILR